MSIDWQGLREALRSKEIDFIFCAGFMKIIPASFLNQWDKPIYNLHPSLLPKYKGLKAIERAYEEGDDIGVSIHTLVAEVDSGQVVLQDKVLEKGSYRGKSVDEVRELTQQKEHQIVSRWIEKYLTNSLNHS
jgi:phosphoribosylglycinamide formyltransferase-1